MQMLRRYSRSWAILLAAMFFVIPATRAGDGGPGGGQVKAMAILDGSKNQIKTDSMVTVQDSAFFDPSNIGNINPSYAVQNQVSLLINEASTLYFRSAFAVTVNVRIYYTATVGNADSIDRVLTVGYDSAKNYNSRSSFAFNGAHKVTVKILSASSNVTGWDPMQVLMIQNQLITHPVFNVSCNNTITNITVSPSSDPSADELPVSWTAVKGADQYDLEWTYIQYSALAGKNPALVFQNNATRITTTGNSYNIPLIYDDAGTLFIRVRPVQVNSAGGGVTASIWSSEAATPVIGQYSYNGHERPLNWQSNISFAEEGKRKVVIQYFDGGLRSRQSVTKDNTTNTTIVSETLYDYQGRPAIQVMPSPTLNKAIQYAASFNVSINGAEYSQSNYDTLPYGSTFCSIHADAMGTQSGASRYFSPANDNASAGLNQFIPDAHNYPFTETEYTPDNTGRISRQGGVGPDFQLGSGHETKYYYGTPDQRELDGLFGTEVGNRSHYFKNMVRDANGQYSVSYVDMHGRTVATALAGLPPSGMAALPSNNSRMVTETLSDSNSVSFQGLSVVSQKSMVVPMAGPYNFHYSLTPALFNEMNCQQQNICYTCKYDLEITVSDNCNNQLLGGNAFDTVIRNFTPGAITPNCTPAGMALDFSLNLPEGSYLVTKKLTVNQDAYNFYRDSIYLPNNTCVTVAQFIQQQKIIAQSANTQCAPTCSACLDSVGTWDQFRSNYIAKAGLTPADTANYSQQMQTAYQNALSSCSVMCKSTLADDNDIVKAMLQDMSPPYGQYADTLRAIGSDIFSIFYIPKNDTASNIPIFQRQELVYTNDQGLPDSVYDPSSGLMVTPNSLTMTQFVYNFRTSWANALLMYHPEFCKLQRLQAHHTSAVWDRQVEAIDTYQDAISQGYLNPTGNTASLPFSRFPAVSANTDPLSTESSDLKNRLEDKLKLYQNAVGKVPNMSMWAMACSMVKCSSEDVGCLVKYTDPNNDFDTNNFCPGELDQAWRNFRQLYLGAKQLIFNQQVLSASGCTLYDPYVKKQYGELKISDIYTAKHQPEFSDVTTSISQDNDLNGLNTVNGSSGAQDQANTWKNKSVSFNMDNIQAFAQQWAYQLSPCTQYDPNDLNQIIIPALMGLCRKAVDENHPFGASTLPLYMTYTFEGVACTSFEDIIRTYNKSHNISDALHCNAEAISFPPPYDNQLSFSSVPVYDQPSDCECTLINRWYIRYILFGKSDASFAAYLHRTQQINLTDDELTTLRGLCKPGSNTGVCPKLSKPILLPPVMQCSVGEAACANCVLISSLYQSYLQKYPSDTPTIHSDADSLQAQKNRLFQNYMNNRLGYNKQAWEYLQFMDTCAAHQSEVNSNTQCSDRAVSNIYISGGADRMTDIMETSDEGYLLAGSTTSSGAQVNAVQPFYTPAPRAYLIKTDQSGAVQWSRSYADGGQSRFSRVRLLSDNNFLAIGKTGGNMFIAKVRSNGDLMWSKAIGFNTAFGETGYDIIETSDRGYVALGTYNENHGHGDLLLARLDTGGNVLWVHRFGTSMSDNASCNVSIPDTISYSGNPSYGLVEVNDTLLVSGTAYDPNLGSGYFGAIYKVDKVSGNIFNSWQYQDSLNHSRSTWFGDIYNTDNGILLSVTSALGYGSDSTQGAMMQISQGGSVLSSSRFNLPPGISKADVASVCPTYDGGYLIAQTAVNSPNIFWQRMDDNGKVIWVNRTSMPGNVVFGRMIQMDDNNFVAAVTIGGHAMLMNILTTPTTNCYDSAVSVGMTQPAIANIRMAAQGDQYLPFSGPYDNLYVSAIQVSDSILACHGGGECFTEVSGPTLCGKSTPLLELAGGLDSITTCTDSTFFAVSKGTGLYNAYSDSLTGHFEQRYNGLCLQAYKSEVFTVTHTLSEYHYTLYYYDQAGNLLKTVPPAGVQQMTDTNWLNQVETAKAAGQVLVPAHTLVTNYRYNSMNEIIAQHSPDGGTSRLWYDRLSRQALSQNARQRLSNQYSYKKYDSIGRIVEIGQLVSATPITDTISRVEAALAGWLSNGASTADQITQTVYDTAYTPLAPQLTPRNLRNRVAWAALYNTASDFANGNANAAAATYYSYDIVGNVDTLVQDYGNGGLYADIKNPMNAHGNRFKKLVYDFDLVSGKVNQISYQHGYQDRFYHQYLYDAENRITNVLSSADSINWENDAFYSYYLHGPMARTILGQQQVQGINYAYTLQGWVKAINPSPYTGPGFTLRPDSMGNVVAASAYNLLLNYFNGDYSPISGAPGPDNGVNTALGASDYRPLYNGNINSMGMSVRGLSNPLLYNYQYDQLNRLVGMDAWNRTSTSWNVITKVPDFGERISYDPNGNILGYKRNGNNTFAGQPLGMDSLNYAYIPGTNQLDHITDSVPASNYTTDIDGQVAGNYKYDSIGQLIADAASGITNISWTVYGKIASITKSGDTTISYTYDPSGHRISKSLIHAGDTLTTWYVRDPQGNVLSVYTYGDPAVRGKDLTQTELHIYGSSRLGILKTSNDVQLDAPVTSVPMHLLGTGDSLIFTRGNRLFELTNHLGNVLATISDKRYGISTDDSTVNYYIPEVVSANDYYPFGSMQPGRSYTESGVGNYRYGFNGKENDNEVKGLGNEIDYGMRVYDPRIAKFLSADPLTETYPWYSPYQYGGNTPIFSVDIDGLEPEKIINKAEGLLFTPYEYGGKNPSPSLIGSLKTDDGYKYWVKDLRPKLQVLSENHPDHNENATDASFAKLRKKTYEEFDKLATGDHTLGIDCSGFVLKSYLADKELLIDPKKLDLGSKGQIDLFKHAEKLGEAYVYKNAGLVSKGDFVYKPGHVMVATGAVRVDKNGNVVEFQTLEANDTEHGSIVKWRANTGAYTFAHPFRTTDTGPRSIIVTYNKKTHALVVTYDNKDRAAANRKQTVEKEPEPVKKKPVRKK